MKTWLKDGLVGLIVGLIIFIISFYKVVNSSNLSISESFVKVLPLFLGIELFFIIICVLIGWGLRKLNKTGKRK